MPTNPPILLLDTNVWLDLFLPHRPNRDTVLDLIDEARARDISLAYPSQALLDVYQKVRSDNKRWIRQTRELTELDALAIKRMAWDYIDMMREFATAIPVDTHDVALACHYRDSHDDLEDDLVLAACQRARATYLVSSDEALAAHAPIACKTPQEMLELLRSGRLRQTEADCADEPQEWFYRWLATWG